MRKISFIIACLTFCWLAETNPVMAQSQKTIWKIGEPDKSYTDLLYLGEYSKFKNDSYYIIGSSKAQQDWSYVHPGPVDSWAGGITHTFTVLWGIRKIGKAGACLLKFDLVDTHSQQPPFLSISINGKEYKQKLPEGGSDESINGNPGKGKNYHFEINFQSSDLKIGNNEISITSLSGSWFLYDAIELTSSTEIKSGIPDSQTAILSVKSLPYLYLRNKKEYQSLLLKIRFSGDPTEATIRVSGTEESKKTVTNGIQDVEIPVSAVSEKKNVEISVELNGKIVAANRCLLEPVQRMTIYVLPHSHTDIGYTEIQTAIETKQVNNLLKGIEYAKMTAGYPPGSRFVWNVEVLWAADLYLKRLNDIQRRDFFEAVKNGQVALNGMYLNVLTGLCRPEELQRLFKYSTQLADKCGITIDAAMTSDIPGQTWGTVTAMNQAGIKYFSTAPNYFDRIGDILLKWENRPFYWVSPSGNEKVLVWIPLKGYAMSHVVKKLSADFVNSYCRQLADLNYPYNITYIRWSGQGDNAEPDMGICGFIRAWNTKYEWPKFVISSTSEAFRAFEEKYGNQLPRVKGDWTPYWEDGAGSSAAETSLNRSSSDRLTQAETIWAMQNPDAYPVSDFDEAWKKVLLYSEHTWGAWCSVSDPENKMTKEQWEIKKDYAFQADKLSKDLIQKAFYNADIKEIGNCVDVYNTSSWTRTNLVVVSKERSATGDRVKDDKGNPVPSQRLKTGELAFVAKNIAPFSSQRFTLSNEAAWTEHKVSVTPYAMDNGLIKLGVNPKTGNIDVLSSSQANLNFVDTTAGFAVNEFIFLPGDKVSEIEQGGDAKITIGEAGPLVASLLVESAAPACNGLVREIRMVAGFDYVEIKNVVDKKRAAVSDKPGDWNFAQKGGKESLNFAFPFNVKNGVLRLDVPFGLMQPEKDQIPSACKNWLTIGNWADVSNTETGITWVSADAPLVELGGITANLPGSQSDPDIWRKKIEPTQTLFSWVMNNHWETNYRAYQEGKVTFRYALKPHLKFNAAHSSRFATELCQPLIVMPSLNRETIKSCVTVENENILVTSFKPSDDGKAWILNLFNSSSELQTTKITFKDDTPKKMRTSNTGEKPLIETGNRISVPAWDVATLRVEL